MVIALAGRRIDEDNAIAPRFPLKNVPLVETRIRAYFSSAKPEALVCSAACGADLLALKVAGELNIYRIMVLPFEPEKFKEKSVLDRPGNWGSLFDQILEEIRLKGKVIILKFADEDHEAYEKTNFQILNQAETLIQEQEANKQLEYRKAKDKVALIIWEGQPKTNHDTTKHFLDEAQKRDFIAKEIYTAS